MEKRDLKGNFHEGKEQLKKKKKEEAQKKELVIIRTGREEKRQKEVLWRQDSLVEDDMCK